MTEIFKKAEGGLLPEVLPITLHKKGNLAQTEEGELVLVDENENAYKVDQTTAAVWNMCDGEKSQEQIVEDISNETEAEKEQVSQAVEDIVGKLSEVELIQKDDQNDDEQSE